MLKKTKQKHNQVFNSIFAPSNTVATILSLGNMSIEASSTLLLLHCSHKTEYKIAKTV